MAGKYDFSNAVNQATKTVEQTPSSGPRIVYPGNGTISVRLLFNTKSQSVMRLIRRHKIEGSKIECLTMYQPECPICKAIDNIKAVTERDLWSSKYRTLGIAFAQYVSCSRGYDWGSYKEPQEGELVLLMFPWSVYKDLSGIIQRAAGFLEELITAPAGRLINITRETGSGQNDRVSYRVEIDAFSPLFNTAGSEEEMDSFLNSIDDLNEVVSPSVLSNEISNKANNIAQSLSSKFIRMNYNEPASVSTMNNPNIPNYYNNAQNKNYQPQPNHPSCYGNCDFKKKDCLVCDYTPECNIETKKRMDK